MIVGFDFGTTNSLISVVVRGRAIDVLDEDGRPHPSVVRYEGEEVVVGREAKHALEEVGLGVHGNIVRSPKFLLGQDVVSVGGVDRSPVDIVAEVVRHVRAESLRSGQSQVLGDLNRAVVTIPVTMDGPRRAALREAFAQAGISVAQFVHEPLAALYGHLRSGPDPVNLVRTLMRRYALVVDWGGGTLDLTLCRVEPGQIVQLRNGGDDQVGGDRFDQVIRDEVVTRFSNRSGIDGTDQPTLEARLRLLQDAERHKITLSEHATATFYRPGYFSSTGTSLEYTLTRQELDEITRPLVTRGIGEIQSLLDSVGMAPAQISLCLVAGGMAAMPAIRSRLHEMFGPERVLVPDNSGTLISQGAAWIAHESQRLVLAKRVELEMARGSRLELLGAGAEMPFDGQLRREQFHLYCTDPSDGVAKFSIVTPTKLGNQPQASDPRTALGMVTISVDKTAPPLVERLELDVEVDDNLILSVKARSSQKKDHRGTEFFDLEFGIGLPGSAELGQVEATDQGDVFVPAGGLVVRANVASSCDSALVPGEVLYRHVPSAFERLPGPDRATPHQLTEHLYYRPCSVCKRRWGDPRCRCASPM